MLVLIQSVIIAMETVVSTICDRISKAIRLPNDTGGAIARP